MSETKKYESTERLNEYCATAISELVKPILESRALPVSMSSTYTYLEENIIRKASQLAQLREGEIPYGTIAAHLTSSEENTVSIGFEIPKFEHRIGTVALYYEGGKITATYDELIQQLLNPT